MWYDRVPDSIMQCVMCGCVVCVCVCVCVVDVTQTCVQKVWPNALTFNTSQLGLSLFQLHLFDLEFKWGKSGALYPKNCTRHDHIHTPALTLHISPIHQRWSQSIPCSFLSVSTVLCTLLYCMILYYTTHLLLVPQTLLSCNNTPALPGFKLPNWKYAVDCVGHCSMRHVFRFNLVQLRQCLRFVCVQSIQYRLSIPHSVTGDHRF